MTLCLKYNLTLPRAMAVELKVHQVEAILMEWVHNNVPELQDAELRTTLREMLHPDAEVRINGKIDPLVVPGPLYQVR